MAAQAFRALRRASALRLRVFLLVATRSGAPSYAFPKAQNKASIAYDRVIRARICGPRNGVHRSSISSQIK